MRRLRHLVHEPNVRERLRVAREALEWPDSIHDCVGSGLNYMIRYLYDEISESARVNLRLDEPPARTGQFACVKEASPSLTHVQGSASPQAPVIRPSRSCGQVVMIALAS